MSKPQGGLAEDAAHLFVAGEWRITLSLIRPKGYAFRCFCPSWSSLPATNAKRLRKGALATKQSIPFETWIASRSLSSGGALRRPVGSP
jgi:hypothetical protein